MAPRSWCKSFANAPGDGIRIDLAMNGYMRVRCGRRQAVIHIEPVVRMIGDQTMNLVDDQGHLVGIITGGRLVVERNRGVHRIEVELDEILAVFDGEQQ